MINEEYIENVNRTGEWLVEEGKKIRSELLKQRGKTLTKELFDRWKHLDDRMKHFQKEMKKITGEEEDWKNEN
jgi:uncharacterized C2H2 Zn-finger protein